MNPFTLFKIHHKILTLIYVRSVKLWWYFVLVVVCCLIYLYFFLREKKQKILDIRKNVKDAIVVSSAPDIQTLFFTASSNCYNK